MCKRQIMETAIGYSENSAFLPCFNGRDAETSNPNKLSTAVFMNPILESDIVRVIFIWLLRQTKIWHKYGLMQCTTAGSKLTEGRAQNLITFWRYFPSEVPQASENKHSPYPFLAKRQRLFEGCSW